MNKKTRFIFYASLLFNFMAVVYFTPKLIRRLNPPEPTPITYNYWMQRDLYLNSLPIDSTSIVMIGTSLTHNFEIQESIGSTFKNRGINGDNLDGILNRIDIIIEAKPKQIIIEAGINDIGDLHRSNEEILSDFKKLIGKIQSSSPKTQILIQSIFPVANSSDQMLGYCSSENNEQITKLNTEISQLSRDMKFDFMNFQKDFELKGELSPPLSMDGVHLSAEGYNLWQKLLLPYLK